MRSRPTSCPIQKTFPSVLYSMHFTGVPKLTEFIQKLKTNSFPEQYLKVLFKQGKPHSTFKLNIANHINQSSHLQIPDLPSQVHCLEMVQFISNQLKIWYPELIIHQAHTMPYIFSAFPHLLSDFYNSKKQTKTVNYHHLRDEKLEAEVYTLAQRQSIIREAGTKNFFLTLQLRPAQPCRNATFHDQ